MHGLKVASNYLVNSVRNEEQNRSRGSPLGKRNRGRPQQQRSSVSDELIWEEDYEGDSFELLGSRTQLEQSILEEQKEEEDGALRFTPSESHPE